MASPSINLLFVCSRNQWRSPTAEKIYSKCPGVNVRSAGTSRNARRTITSNDLQWADLVLVMESKHRQKLRADFPGEMKHKKCHVLEIPDDYEYMDPDLIDMIRQSVDEVL